jgi:hypothetical protein
VRIVRLDGFDIGWRRYRLFDGSAHWLTAKHHRAAVFPAVAGHLVGDVHSSPRWQWFRDGAQIAGAGWHKHRCLKPSQ